MRKYGTTGAVFFLLLVLIVFVVSLNNIRGKNEPLTYSQLETILRDKDKVRGEIDKVFYTNSESVIQVVLHSDPQHEKPVVVPAEAKEQLLKQLTDAGVTVEVKEPDKSSFWFSMLSSFFLPILLLVG